MHFKLEGIVWIVQCEADFAERSGWLTSREKERAASMRYAKRRMDYLLGRWTAKSALARVIGLAAEPETLARVEVRNARDGSPRAFFDDAPADCAISMTDRAGWAVCALASPTVELGCDVELVETRSELFIFDFLTEAEQSAVRSAPPGPARDLLANLMWSAKESALKLLRTGLRRDTRSVEVRLDQIGDDCRWRGFSVDCDGTRKFYGWWRRFGAFVLTVVSSPKLDAPTCLVDEERLALGEPTHTWLASPLADDELC